jgi:hypothetical protein
MRRHRYTLKQITNPVKDLREEGCHEPGCSSEYQVPGMFADSGDNQTRGDSEEGLPSYEKGVDHIGDQRCYHRIEQG